MFWVLLRSLVFSDVYVYMEYNVGEELIYYFKIRAEYKNEMGKKHIKYYLYK